MNRVAKNYELVGNCASSLSLSMVMVLNRSQRRKSGCTTNCKYIGMIAFNQGGTVVEQRGTVVEYNGLGYVERTALGTWRSTGTSAYRFRMKNFVFDSTGKLSAFIIGTSDVTLGSTLNSFSGSGTAQIFKAGGTLIGATAFTITGTRF